MDTPPIPELIKHRAATIAENLCSTLTDVDDVMRELQDATTDVAPSCAASDFVTMVLEHITNEDQREAARKAVTDFSVREIRKAGGMGDVLGKTQNELPYSATFGALPFRGHVPADTRPTHYTPFPSSTKGARFKELYKQLLSLQPPLEGVTGPAEWLLCQIATESGMKAAGALREHETGLCVFLTQGKAPNGAVAEVEYYLDWADLEALMIPKMASPRIGQ